MAAPIGHNKPGESPALLKPISDLVEEAGRLKEQIDQLQDDLKECNKALWVIEREKLPSLMSEAGLERIEAHGYAVAVEPSVEGGLPKEDLERREKALDWIASHDGEELIKTEVKLSFGKGDAKLAQKVEKLLRKAGYTPEVGRNIHPATLLAWVRERLRNGDPISPDTIGVQIGTIARLKAGRKKK